MTRRPRRRVDPAGLGVLAGLLCGTAIGWATWGYSSPAPEGPAPVTVLVGECTATMEWNGGKYELWLEE